MWTLDGTDGAIIALQARTKQTCTISITLCSLRLLHADKYHHSQQQGKQGGAYGFCGVLVVDEDTLRISGLASIQTNLPAQKDQRRAMRER